MDFDFVYEIYIMHTVFYLKEMILILKPVTIIFNFSR